jgi:xylulokinase
VSLLGVDIGTSGCRAVAFAEDGRRLAAASETYAVTHGPGARAVQDIDAVWAAVESCLREVNAAVGAIDPVEALAFAAQGEAVVAVDAAGRALGPAPLSFDYRAAAEAAQVVDAVGHERFRAITGVTAHPMFTAFKLAWWLRHDPDGAGAARRFHCYGDLAAVRLGVEPAIDYTLATRTAMLDAAARRWSPELLDTVGIDAGRLATPVPCGSPLGPIAGDRAAALGFTGTPLLVAGAHDQAAAAWGAGVRRHGDAHLSLGTSDCLTTAVTDAPGHLHASVYPYSPYDDGDTWLVLAGLPSGGAALAWFVTEFGADLHGAHNGRSPYDILYESMADDAGDVVVLPHFAGSGTYDDDASSTAAIVGLTLATTRAQVARALIESSGFETARNIAALQAAGVRIADIRVGGGGARNRRGLVIRAEAMGRSLLIPPTPADVTCRGAALLAAVGLGRFQSIEAAATAREDEIVTPAPDRIDALATRRTTYARLYPALQRVRDAQQPEPDHSEETPHGHHP